MNFFFWCLYQKLINYLLAIISSQQYHTDYNSISCSLFSMLFMRLMLLLLFLLFYSLGELSSCIRGKIKNSSLLSTFCWPWSAMGMKYAQIEFLLNSFANIWYAVTLSKTKKKGKEHKEAIVNAIKHALEDYSSAYVFTFENMRNLKFKEFREQLKSSSRYLICFFFFNIHHASYFCSSILHV